MAEIKLITGVYQDGAQFYRESEDGDYCIASYSWLVNGDFDTEGAQLARNQFAQDWPEYAYRVIF